MSDRWAKSEVSINGVIPLSLYRSTRSRLLVAVADAPGPTVNGCMTFATETDSDDGLPHTLEHLVFMGSEKCPYKGFLDVAANRCLASGTNAWTSQDHTAYTLSTVGSEGFLKILPIFMEHVLSPTLTASQFATEVHHINGEGKDAGVVYCEMQDHDQAINRIMHRKMKKELYPPGSPYAAETGGRLENLRTSCNLQKVRDYHKKYYHLSNMMIIVCGKVDHKRLLSTVEEVEREQLDKIPPFFSSPFNLKIPPLTKSSVYTVLCPSDDESRGMVYMAWHGPVAGDLVSINALNVMLEYMTNTAVSPISKDFINTETPLASSVDYLVDEQAISHIRLRFCGVPTAKLNDIRSRFFDKTCRNLLVESDWDMERMGFLIEKNIQRELVQLETNPSKIFRQIIQYQLYDKDNLETLKARANMVDILKKLRSEPALFWMKLLEKFLMSPSITIIGMPDKKLVAQIAKDEAERIKKQQTQLGKDGMEQKGKQIAEAIMENTKNKPTAELLDQLIVKNLETFDRFPVVTISNVGNGSANSLDSQFLSQFPFPSYLHNSPSKFIQLHLLQDTSSLVTEQRAWLYLYNDLLFESPAMINGVLKPADDVAKLCTKDLIERHSNVSISGCFQQFLCLTMKVPVDRGFPLLAKWTKIFTRGIVFDVARIKQRAQKLASSAREYKRDGNSVALSALTATMYSMNTNHNIFDRLVLEKFHERVIEMCDKEPEKVVKCLEEVRNAMYKRGMNAHFICNVDLIDRSQFDSQLWHWAVDPMVKAESFQSVSCEYANPSSIGKDIIIPVGGSESAFIKQSCIFDADWNSPEFLPTTLFGQYLSQSEGPLWRSIRGEGLAYGAYIYVLSDRKLIYLTLYRCSQPTQAYIQSKKIVESIISSGNIEESEFEAAKRSLIFTLMSKEQTVSMAGTVAIQSIFRKLSPQYIREACERIWHMNKTEMMAIAGPRVAKLFTDFTRVIIVHPSKLPEVSEAFSTAKTSSIAALYYEM